MAYWGLAFYSFFGIFAFSELSSITKTLQLHLQVCIVRKTKWFISLCSSMPVWLSWWWLDMSSNALLQLTMSVDWSHLLHTRKAGTSTNAGSLLWVRSPYIEAMRFFMVCAPLDQTTKIVAWSSRTPNAGHPRKKHSVQPTLGALTLTPFSFCCVSTKEGLFVCHDGLSDCCCAHQTLVNVLTLSCTLTMVPLD